MFRVYSSNLSHKQKFASVSLALAAMLQSCTGTSKQPYNVTMGSGSLNLPGTSPTPTPTPVSSTTFNIQSPANNATVSGTVTILGQAGSDWVNIAMRNESTMLASDVTPSNGTYSVTLNTATLTNGSNTLTLTAYSVAAGQSGGTDSSANLTLNVQNAASFVGSGDSLNGHGPGQAARASALTNMLGVNTHFSHSGTPYQTLSTVQASMAYLNPNGVGTGVSIIRDQILYSPMTFFSSLGAEGYKMDLFEGYNAAVGNSFSAMTSGVSSLVSSGYVREVEGPLEVDNSGWGMATDSGTSYTNASGATYSGWQAPVAAQIDIFNTDFRVREFPSFFPPWSFHFPWNSPKIQSVRYIV